MMMMTLKSFLTLWRKVIWYHLIDWMNVLSTFLCKYILYKFQLLSCYCWQKLLQIEWCEAFQHILYICEWLDWQNNPFLPKLNVWRIWFNSTKWNIDTSFSQVQTPSKSLDAFCVQIWLFVLHNTLFYLFVFSSFFIQSFFIRQFSIRV